MTSQREAAAGIKVGDMEFDHPEMIRARRQWAEALTRGHLADGDVELVKYMHVVSIRDRLAADLINPYAWEDPEYSGIFLGDFDPALIDVKRMKTATELCIGLLLQTEDSDHAPMIMIMAFIQWMLGSNDLARQGAVLALVAHPGYELAQLMLMIIARGIQPAYMSRA